MLNALKDVISKVFVQFMPPLPRKSYTFESDDAASRYVIRLKHGTEWFHCHRHPEKFEAFFTPSKSGNDIACLYIHCVENPKYTILFSHGGTVDLGNLCNFFYTLGNRLNCNIFSYDYSGFGESKGQPTEKNVYADAEAAWDVLINKYGLSWEQDHSLRPESGHRRQHLLSAKTQCLGHCSALAIPFYCANLHAFRPQWQQWYQILRFVR